MQPWQSRSLEFHPYMVDTVDALPDSLRDAAREALAPGERMVRAFVIPPEYRSSEGSKSQDVPEQALVFTASGAWHIQAPVDGSAASSTYLEPHKILWIRTYHLLLFGRVELASATRGAMTAIEMEFNAIGWRLMQAEWHNLVGKALGLPPLAPEEEPAIGETEKQLLAGVPEKFVDGLQRYGLYTGEKLLGAVFQPEIWKQNFLTLDEQLLPNTLAVLTESSVLVMAEEPALVRDSDVLGLIILRIPCRAIKSVEAAGRDALVAIRFALACEDVAGEQEVVLGSEAAQAWLELWNKQ